MVKTTQDCLLSAIAELKRDIRRMNTPYSPQLYPKMLTLLRFELPKGEQSIVNLKAQKKDLEDIYSKLGEVVNHQEHSALSKLKEKALGLLEDIQNLEASYSTFDVCDFYALNHAKNSFHWAANAHARLAHKLNDPEPSPRFDFEEFDNRFNEHFRTHRRESFKTYVVSQMFISVPSDEELSETLDRLPPKVLVFFSEMAKREVLLALAPNKSCPKPLEPFRLKKSSPLLRIPSALWSSYLTDFSLDFLNLKGVSEPELEAINVLYGGAAYQTLDEALAAARTLG